MSLGDYQWHKKLFSIDWKRALTIIVNAQKQQISAYAGPAADHVEMHMLYYKNE